MTKEEIERLKGLNNRPVVKTLALHRAGLPAREFLSDPTYYKHRKMLIDNGFEDISKPREPLETRYRVKDLVKTDIEGVYRVA